MSAREDMGRADETEDSFPRGMLRGSEFRRRREGRRGNGVKNPNGREAIPVPLPRYVVAGYFKAARLQNKKWSLHDLFQLTKMASLNKIGPYRKEDI
jgi:hypothetical protein